MTAGDLHTEVRCKKTTTANLKIGKSCKDVNRVLLFIHQKTFMMTKLVILVISC